MPIHQLHNQDKLLSAYPGSPRLAQSNHGIILIDLMIFLVGISIIATQLLLTMQASLNVIPFNYQQNIASGYAVRCIEWYWGKRHASNDGFDAIPLTTSALPLPANFCQQNLPAGYTVNATVTGVVYNNEPLPMDDNYHYKLITVTVTTPQKLAYKIPLILAQY